MVYALQRKAAQEKTEVEAGLPMKTPDGRVVFEQEDDVTAAELVSQRRSVS